MKMLALALALLLAGATPASAEKFTMLCGDLELLVVVKLRLDNSYKTDIYPSENERRPFEVRDGALYVDGKMHQFSRRGAHLYMDARCALSRRVGFALLKANADAL
jgi:hypothetical protein